jgi:NADH-quinone oxidoreductase subunit J
MTTIFLILAVLAVGSALMVVTRRNAVHSALWLVLTFFSVAGLFVTLKAEFIAAVQILVYAGGIMVLFLFVIMLVNLEQVGGALRSSARRAAALTGAGLLVGTLAAVLLGARPPVAAPLPDPGTVSAGRSVVEGVMTGNMEAVGMQLLTTDLLPFELVSVILFVGVLGAIVLCRREL